MSTEETNKVIGIIKEWASPVLIGILGMFIWRDLSELRQDVRFLVTQQSADTVKIKVLENDLNILKNNFRELEKDFYRTETYAIKEEEIKLPKKDPKPTIN